MSIDWETIGRESFERIVEALILRRYDAPGTRVIVPDGRGGDMGIDIEVRQGERRRIFQLKYFPGGFSSENRKRRQQITASFERATKLDPYPYEWILVVPTKLTIGERQFVDSFAGGPRINVLDRPRLDVLASNYPDIPNFLTRKLLDDNARLFSQERQNLLNGQPDLTERLRNLGRIGDSTDLDYAVDFERFGETIRYYLRPKHSYAKPMTITVTGAFGAQHGDIREQLTRTLDWGTTDRIILPAETVRNLHIDGPELFAGDHGSVEVHIEPLRNNDHIGSRVDIRMYSTDGRQIASHQGKATDIDRGRIGFTLGVDLYDHMSILILFPYDKSIPGEIRMTYNLRDIRPADARALLSLARQLRTPGAFKAYINDDHIVTMANNDPLVPDSEGAELAVIEEICGDLEIVQRHCNTTFTVPDEFTVTERISLRVARLLIEGKTVASHNIGSFTLTLDGEDNPTLRLALRHRSQVRVTATDFAITIGSRDLTLGDVYVFHSNTVAENGPQVLAALDRGRAAAKGFKIKLKVANNASFHLLLAGDHREPDFDQPPTPWNLSGIDQP